MRDDCKLKNKSSNSSLEVEGEREWRITNVLFGRLRAPYRDTVFLSTKTKKYMYMCELYACSVQWMFHCSMVASDRRFFFFCYLLICDVKSSIIKLKKSPVSELPSLCILHICTCKFIPSRILFDFPYFYIFSICVSLSVCFWSYVFLHTKKHSILSNVKKKTTIVARRSSSRFNPEQKLEKIAI